MNLERRASGRITSFLGGLGIGAGLMYTFDPNRGARRRSLMRDKATHVLHEQGEVIEKGVRDLEHRAVGLVARVRSAFVAEEVSDEKLVARVRAQLGRAVTNPGSIEVSAEQGRVTLSGPIFADEVDELVHRVQRVRGVREVENRLEPHEPGEGIPGLQGSPRRPPLPLLQRESWPPAVRLVVGGAGLSMSAYGIQRGGLIGGLFTGLGALALLRAMAGKPGNRLARTEARRRGAEVEEPVTQAPGTRAEAQREVEELAPSLH